MLVSVSVYFHHRKKTIIVTTFEKNVNFLAEK